MYTEDANTGIQHVVHAFVLFVTLQGAETCRDREGRLFHTHGYRVGAANMPTLKPSRGPGPGQSIPHVLAASARGSSSTPSGALPAALAATTPLVTLPDVATSVSPRRAEVAICRTTMFPPASERGRDPSPVPAAAATRTDVDAFLVELLGAKWVVRPRSPLDSLALKGPERRFDVVCRGEQDVTEASREISKRVCFSVETTTTSLHIFANLDDEYQLSFAMNEDWNRSRTDRHLGSPLVTSSERVTSVATTSCHVSLFLHASDPLDLAREVEEVAPTVVEDLARWNEVIVAVSAETQLSPRDQRLLLIEINRKLLLRPGGAALDPFDAFAFWESLELGKVYVHSPIQTNEIADSESQLLRPSRLPHPPCCPRDHRPSHHTV